MTYQKAMLDVELFDVEDVIVTSPASATGPEKIVDEGSVVPPTPQPDPQPGPAPIGDSKEGSGIQ